MHKSTLAFIVIILGLVVLWVRFAADFNARRAGPPIAPTATHALPTSVGVVLIGKDGYLDDGTTAFYFVAATDAAYETVRKGDSSAIVRLMNAGLIVRVPRHTRIRVLDHATFSERVQILDGDSTGFTGWVASDAVRP